MRKNRGEGGVSSINETRVFSRKILEDTRRWLLCNNNNNGVLVLFFFLFLGGNNVKSSKTFGERVTECKTNELCFEERGKGRGEFIVAREAGRIYGRGMFERV